MSYRNKIYVCFDGDNDIHYYRLMKAWKRNNNTPFNFFDAHDLNTALDTSLESTIKRRLRERLTNSKVFIVLIGSQTRYLYRFVRWEMEQAINLSIPIIGINLNGLRFQDSEKCPPLIRDCLAVYISFNVSIMQYAIDNWPNVHFSKLSQNDKGPCYYVDSVYNGLGL